jgi:hypothetical protein
MTQTRPTIQRSSTGGRLADRVEARLNELKAENAKLRGFVQNVADARRPVGGSMSNDAQKLLNELEVTA